MFNINPQLLLSEMKLFASTDAEVDINFIQKEPTDDFYSQDHKIGAISNTLPMGSVTAEEFFNLSAAMNTKLAAIDHGTGTNFFFGFSKYRETRVT